MATERILDLLDQAKAMGFRGQVAFYHYSEPLLDERNVMLACEARKRGMRPYLHTNGDVLRRNDRLCNEVSEIYELIVVGLYDYRTKEELDESQRYWYERLPFANLSFSPIGLAGGAGSARSIGVPRALVPPDPRMSIPDLVFTNAPCHRPLIRMLIQYDGTMCHCCEDIHGSFHLGNVHQTSLEQLWFSEHHQKVIADLIDGARDKYQLCRACPMSPTAPAPLGKSIGVFRGRRTAAR
jgi:radical SAM protein with 4Fe4S-binding SPASM domain